MGQRRKHVTSAVAQDVQPPDENQQIVKALGSRGGNLVEVEYPDGVTTLCMMPAKFNRKLWVKRGGYLIIESSAEAEQDKGSRVTGTICAVLYEEHIKQLKKMPGVWPAKFVSTQQLAAAAAADSDLPPVSSSDDEAGDAAAATADAQAQASTSQGAAGAAGAAAGPGCAQQQQSQPAAAAAAAADSDMEEEESDDGLPPLQQINNRRVIQHYAMDSDSGSESS